MKILKIHFLIKLKYIYILKRCNSIDCNLFRLAKVVREQIGKWLFCYYESVTNICLLSAPIIEHNEGTKQLELKKDSSCGNTVSKT